MACIVPGDRVRDGHFSSISWHRRGVKTMLALVALLGVCACRGKEKAAPPPDPVPDAGPPVRERWAGTITIPGDVPLIFELRIECGAEPAAAMAIPVQHLEPTGLVDVSCGDTAMRFTLALPGVPDEGKARFAVERQPDGTAAGTLHQNGADMRVTMRRLAEDEALPAAANRPQTPAPPFPYDERAASYASKDGTALAGTLTLPRGGGPFPAVILVTGTGTQDRDETLFGHKPFGVLADHLTRAGIAVLRVDDRGIGGSGGSTDDSGLETKVDDVLAGLTWLATQPEIDKARLGVIGHSEGGTIAPMAAASSPAVAFLVLLAAPAVPGGAIGEHQMEILMRAQHAPDSLIALRVKGQHELIARAVAGAGVDELRAAVHAHFDELQAQAGVRLDDATRATMEAASLAQLTTAAARSFLAIDPRPFLEKVTVPVLALWGSLDLQVDPAQNEAPMKAALAGNRDVVTKVLPGLNHLFQPAKLGIVDEYATIETTFDPSALDEITAWLQRR
jgi:pimeloyl-ACP methyl ester carboxylesterase